MRDFLKWVWNGRMVFRCCSIGYYNFSKPSSSFLSCCTVSLNLPLLNHMLFLHFRCYNTLCYNTCWIFKGYNISMLQLNFFLLGLSFWFLSAFLNIQSLCFLWADCLNLFLFEGVTFGSVTPDLSVDVVTSAASTSVRISLFSCWGGFTGS